MFSRSLGNSKKKKRGSPPLQLTRQDKKGLAVEQARRYIPEGRAHGSVAAALGEGFVGRFAVRFHHSDWPRNRLLVRANMPSVM